MKEEIGKRFFKYGKICNKVFFYLNVLLLLVYILLYWQCFQDFIVYINDILSMFQKFLLYFGFVLLFDYIIERVLYIVKISLCVIRFLDFGLFKYVIQLYFDKYLFIF